MSIVTARSRETMKRVNRRTSPSPQPLKRSSVEEIIGHVGAFKRHVTGASLQGAEAFVLENMPRLEFDSVVREEIKQAFERL